MNTGSLILIIDDDEKLNALLCEYLQKYGMRTVGAFDAEDGVRKAKTEKPDLIILDIMLPGRDGFSVCRELRVNSSIPIIMLTARGDVTDCIVGLEIGADDYLAKPFEPRELVARIQSVLRRAGATNNDSVMTHGPVTINFDSQHVTLSGSPVNLTTLEFSLLAVFFKNRGRVLSRDYIMDTLKGMDWEAYDRSIDVLISRLRQKLNDNPRSPKLILTIRGAGYKYIGE